MTTCMQEGDLVFEFPTPDVLKYDDSSFYRNQFSCKCTRSNAAMDFLYCDAGASWLIEVKDFRVYPRTKPTDLVDEIARKVRDTLAGVAAAMGCQANTDPATQKMAGCFIRCGRYRVVLHLEQPKHCSKLNPTIYKVADLKQKLRQLVRAVDAHALVVDTTSCEQYCPWSVKAVVRARASDNS